MKMPPPACQVWADGGPVGGIWFSGSRDTLEEVFVNAPGDAFAET